MDERTRQNLERVDRTNAELAAREVPDRLWEAPQPPEPRASPQPAPQPRAAASPAPPTPDEFIRPTHGPDGRITEIEKFKGSSAQAARSWQAYIGREINKRIENFARVLGQEMGLVDNEERALWRGAIAAAEARLTERLEASDAAVVDLLQQAERRIAALEERLSEPSRRVVAPADQSQVSETTATARGPTPFPGRGGQPRSRSAMDAAA